MNNEEEIITKYLLEELSNKIVNNKDMKNYLLEELSNINSILQSQIDEEGLWILDEEKISKLNQIQINISNTVDKEM